MDLIMRFLRSTRARRVLAGTAALLVLLLLATGVYSRIRGESGDDAEDGPSTDGVASSAAGSFATDVAIPVEGAEVVRDTLILSVGASGQAAAWNMAVVSAQVAGRVSSVTVRENQVVGRDQLLVAIDSEEYRLAVEAAQAGVRTAEARYRELTLHDELIDDPAIREQRAQFARASSGLESAEITLRQARHDLVRTRLTAPFPGRAASIQVVPGEWVQAGDEVMTIVNLDPIKVEVQVLDTEVGFLAPDRRASVSFSAFPGQIFTGSIATINPIVESGTRTARVTVLVDNSDGRILPGMYARVALEARRYADRLLVPRSAVLERDRRNMLFVYDGDDRGGLAKWRYVTTGLANDSVVEIVPSEETDSVAPGEVVLTGGHYTLIHDARVRVVPDAEAAGGRPN
jgi:RND family efflux transporter MFP subunit